MEIKASRGVMFYGSLFLMAILCGGLATLLVFVAIDQKPVDYSLLFFAFIFLFILAFTIVLFSKRTPIVTMSDEGIRFTGRSYGWTQITTADFIANKPLLPGGDPSAAITLTFDDGTALCIIDQMYVNGYEMRKYLQSQVKADIQVQPRMEEESNEVTPQNRQKRHLFVYLYVAIALPISFLMVYFDLPKGISILISLLCVIFYIFISKKLKKR